MSCVSTPTATQYSTLVSSSVSTSFSEQVTSLPDTTSTILSTSCLSSAGISLSGSSGAGVGTCVSSTVVTSTTVINGGVSTTQVPFEITNAFTSSIPTNTLFAPCTTQDTTTTTTSPTTTTTSTPTTTSAQFSTQFSQSQTTVFTTPTTTFTSSQESTLGDGQITQIIVTVISALPPTSAVLSSSVPIATTQVNDNSSGNNGSLALGAIIGGSVGGFFGLLAIVAAVWFYRRRRTNFDDIFEKDYEEYAGGKPLAPKRGRMLDLEDEPIDVLEANTQPKPYVYGLVGASMGNSPPSLNAGLAPAGAESRLSLTTHTRSSSMTPLVVNNNAPGSRPVSIAGGSQALHSDGRSGSPGPLGVQIPTGPAFATPLAAEGESPTSILPPRGPLFVANATDPWSPPGSPAPRSSVTPTISNDKRSSINNVAGPSAASPTGFGAPPGAFAYLAERQQQQNLQRDNTVSSASVYSQPSRAPTPPPSKALGAGSRRTSAGVVVHTDGGRVTQPPDQPPAYRD